MMKNRSSTAGRVSRMRLHGTGSRLTGRPEANPGEETEAVGDADAIKSTALGLKNLQRVSKMLGPGYHR